MIELEHTSHTFAGQPVLRDISLTVNEGERVVLLGCNGSGKSTLLKVLDGLIWPDTGTLRYDGWPVNKQTLSDPDFAARFRREVVLLFQNPDSMLFHPTVREEIAFGPRQLKLDDVDERVAHWAREIGIASILDRQPFTLSSGEKQKVCLASLLVLEPKLLLLDEPTASLDPRVTGWLIDFLQDLALTTVVTTHNLSLAVELGERFILLGEDHMILHDGPSDNLPDDQELLLRANLVHIHRHLHEGVEHRHFHIHDWD
ncbi:MAG: ABC transporter ATP-binding protein [bacterium]